MANAPIRRHLGRELLLAPPTAPRIARFVLCAWLLALGGIWASQQVHAGLHEHMDLPPIFHLVRDASLAVPLAAVAIALGGLITLEVTGILGVRPGAPAGRVIAAIAIAILFAALSIPGNEMHGLLFGAEVEELSGLADLAFDAGVVLVAGLVVLLPATLLGLTPWPPDDDEAEFIPTPFTTVPQ